MLMTFVYQPDVKMLMSYADRGVTTLFCDERKGM